MSKKNNIFVIILKILISFKCFRFNFNFYHLFVFTNILQHFPSYVAKECLRPNQTEMDNIDVDTEYVYPCVVKTGRTNNEKYLCGGWYDYVRLNRLKVGDVLLCTVPYLPTILFVRFMM